MRNAVLSLLQASSMELKSGEYGGRNSSRVPYAATRSAMPAILWTRKLLRTNTYSGRSVGPSAWSR